MLKGTLDFFNLIYPVGSIYMSMDSTNPHDLFGGTWQQIIGRFLWGTENTPGVMGGEVEHTLTINEMPSHTHSALVGSAGGGGGLYPPVGSWTNEQYNLNHLCSYTGGNAPHNNMPPYIQVYIWKRTA